MFPGSKQFGLRFSDASWLGPVRFGSASGSGRFRNSTVRFGSVWPVRFGFLLLPGNYGRFSKAHVLFCSDPEHACSSRETCWIYHGVTHNSMYLDVGFETLDLNLCELNYEN